MKEKWGGLATAIGSLPHQETGPACELVWKYLPELPAWPQLPRRSFLENMYTQFSQGFPGLAIQGERIYLDPSFPLEGALEKLYQAYLDNDLSQGTIGQGYAAGLHAFLQGKPKTRGGVKGQVTGPVSMGLAIADREGRPLLYDEVLSDALAKHLRLKAAWQEQALKALAQQTVLFIDEPYLSQIGSAFISLPREKAVTLLEEVLAGVQGLTGVHCCGNTDWGLLLSTSLDILSFDAYNYALSLSLYPGEVKAFLGRGGLVAWGIVPNEEAALAQETTSSLLQRLEEAMGLLEVKGVDKQALVRQSLLTPSCGLAGVSVAAAERALELLSELSCQWRNKYRLG